MDHEQLAEADRIVASLSPATREGVREIIVNAVHHGHLSDGARNYLIAATQSTVVADVLAKALDEQRDHPDVALPRQQSDSPPDGDGDGDGPGIPSHVSGSTG